MGFIESLNKYGKKIPLQKTQIYQSMEALFTQMKQMGLSVKIKNEYDLFDYEVIYRGMLTQNRIENSYEIFLNQHYDLMDYLNYDEKRKMFNNDIVSLLQEVPHFYSEEHQLNIYIPYLEPFVNHIYADDYQLMMLKQHREYVDQYRVAQKTPMELYGIHIYETAFSSLEKVYEDQRHICYYYPDLRTVYIFKKDNRELLNQVIIQDHTSDLDVSIEDVKEIMDNIENYRYQECLEIMKERGYISNKTYHKIMKKYK